MVAVVPTLELVAVMPPVSDKVPPLTEAPALPPEFSNTRPAKVWEYPCKFKLASATSRGTTLGAIWLGALSFTASSFTIKSPAGIANPLPAFKYTVPALPGLPPFRTVPPVCEFSALNHVVGELQGV